MDITQTFTVPLTAIALGLFGSVQHCAMMCGGVVVAIESAGKQQITLQRASPYDMMGRLLLMHLGRICAYMTLGFVIALLGSMLWRHRILNVQVGLQIVANCLMGFYGLMILLDSLQALRWRAVERVMTKLWQWARRQLSPYAGLLFPAQRGWQRFVVGYLWGFLPCGLVYSALSMSLLAPTPADGARLMFGFGLGTLPSLMLLSGAASSMQKFAKRQDVRMLAGGLILLFAFWGLWKAISGSVHMHH